jgi:two-component system, NarL family, response regulator NreC
MAKPHTGNSGIVTVIVASPVQVTCDALRGVLKQERWLRILEQHGSTYKVVSACRENPDVIVVCDGSSAEALRFIAASSRRFAHCRVVVFGVRSRKEFLRNCGDVRIHGLLSRDSTLKELIDAIRYVHSNGSFISTPLRLSANGRSVARLTSRERTIAALISRRLTNKQIAGRLRVSEHTVKAHVRHILAKLDARGRNEVPAAIGSD